MNYRITLLLILGHLTLWAQSSEPEPYTMGKTVTLHSEAMNEDRVVHLYAPEGYEDMENLAVVFVLDGYSQFRQTAMTIDYLSAVEQGNDKLPPSIVVGITNPNRNYDFTPFKAVIAKDSTTYEATGGGPKFLEFITTELIPYVDNKYNTCAHRTLIGHSLGGLAVFQALLEKRDYFDNYLAHDPALGFADRKFYHQILDTLATANLSSEYLYVSSANSRPTDMTEAEFLADTSFFLGQMDKPNLDFLNQETDDWRIQLHRKYYENDDHFSVPIVATIEAMRLFYSYYPFKDMMNYFHPSWADRRDLVPRLKKHYQHISQQMRTEIKPSEHYIKVWAWGSVVDRKDLAYDLYDYSMELYPESPGVYDRYGDFLEQQGEVSKAVEQYEKSLKLEQNGYVQEKRDALLERIKNNK